MVRKIFAFAGIATLWGAIAADMGASLLVISSGLRLLSPVGTKEADSASATG